VKNRFTTPERLPKIPLAISLLATASFATLTSVPLSAQAISFTIGNQSFTGNSSATNYTGHSFTPNVGGSAADANFSIVLANNPSQVYLNNFTFTGFTGTAPAVLNIYSDATRNITSLLTSSTSNSGFSYTFDGLTPLTFGTQYYAFYPTDVTLTTRFSNANPYSGGSPYRGGAAVTAGDSTFTATFSDTDPTAVPFEFEPTGAVVILGGLWGLKRLVQKKLKS
jgi:hypothetical protein